MCVRQTISFTNLRSAKMNPLLAETFMVMLILAYAIMAGVFVSSHKKGHTFVASFDKAFVWGGALFIIGYSLDSVAYVAIA
jgi:hypothetical protein